MSPFLVTGYLFAIIAANNLVATMGPKGLLITGLILIPFDLVSRDVLHDNWKEYRLVKMFCLVMVGAFLSYLTNSAAKNIAIAGAAALTCAGVIDYIIYSLAESKSRLFKMNVSNVFSSLVDSIVFQAIAFGAVSASITWSQTLIKFIGAIVWSLLLVKLVDKMSKNNGAKNA